MNTTFGLFFCEFLLYFLCFLLSGYNVCMTGSVNACSAKLNWGNG
jgi:hypothetical protein